LLIRFVGIDPDTGGDHCPAVFVDDHTGDFILQGWTVSDPDVLAAVARYCRITDGDSVVRLPARMRAIILEAVNGQGTAVQRADRGDYWPAVLVDEETGDFIVHGRTISDPDVLAGVTRYSPIADNELVVRLPAWMRAIILEAVNGEGSAVQRADRGGQQFSGASGDARRLHPVRSCLPRLAGRETG
jgi:hypothetical protein